MHNKALACLKEYLSSMSQILKHLNKKELFLKPNKILEIHKQILSYDVQDIVAFQDFYSSLDKNEKSKLLK